MAYEVQIEQTKDAGLELCAALVMVEVKGIDGVFGLQAGELEAAFDGTLRAGLQFQIQESFQDLSDAEIFASSISQGLIQMMAHRGQVELFQFLLQ